MKIFVYGSLKRGKKLHYYLKNAKFLGEGITCKKYALIVSKLGWYPYLLNKNKGFRVKGEIYEVNYSLLKKLDKLEEVPFYYIRKQICVKINGKSLKVWCYLKKKPVKIFNKKLLITF